MLDIDRGSSYREASSPSALFTMQWEHTPSHSVDASHTSDWCLLHIRMMHVCMYVHRCCLCVVCKLRTKKLGSKITLAEVG